MNRFGLTIAIACVPLAGCASFSQLWTDPVVAATGLVPSAERIEVFENSPPGARQYHFVKRLWVESVKSAFEVPRYASVKAGMADLRNNAAALGGDAIVNFGCYDISSREEATWHAPMAKVRIAPREASSTPAVPAYSRPALVCNGTVIKYDS